MKLNQKGFSLAYILIAALLLIAVSVTFYFVSNKTGQSKNVTKSGESVRNYDLDGLATIDFPCSPKTQKVSDTKNKRYIHYDCYQNGEQYPSHNRYAINLYAYGSVESYNEDDQSCSFRDKGVQTISGLPLNICNMSVNDANPAETIFATLNIPNKKLRVEFFVEDETYDLALEKLTYFTSTYKTK